MDGWWPAALDTEKQLSWSIKTGRGQADMGKGDTPLLLEDGMVLKWQEFVPNNLQYYGFDGLGVVMVYSMHSTHCSIISYLDYYLILQDYTRHQLQMYEAYFFLLH